MKYRSLADKLTRELGFKVSYHQVAAADGNPEGKRNDDTKNKEDVILAELQNANVIPLPLSEGASASDDEAANGEAAEQLVGKGLVWTPEAKRNKSQTDEDNLDWCRRLIEADRQLYFGPRFKPHYEAQGTGVRYVDPLMEFLEPHEMRGKDGTGQPCNWIHIGLEELELYESEGNTQHFRWRSNEILNKFERKLTSLWLAHRICRGCWQELVTGLRSEVKEILARRMFLPETEGVKPSQILKFPAFHPWCLDIRRELVKLRVALQDKQGDDPEAIAFRSDYLIKMVDRVYRKHIEEDITPSHIVKAVRETLRMLEEVAQRARTR